MTTRHFRWLPTLFLPLLGCSPSVPEATPQHTVRQLTRTTNPLDWSHSTRPRDEFLRLVAPRLARNGIPAKFLDEAHPATRWVQGWLNLIDTRMRTQFPTQLQAVPKPVALVKMDDDPNAFTVPIPTCVDVPTVLAATPQEPVSGLTIGITFSGLVFPAPNPVCLPEGAATPALVIEHFQRNNGSCSLNTSDGLRMTPGTDCRLATALAEQNIQAAGRFQTNATSPVITITTGLLRLADNENVVAATLAHELVHLYRSHPAMRPARFNFFYRLGPYGERWTPAPAPQLEPLGKEAVRICRNGTTTPAARKVLARAHTERLGHYTFEQEADEMALEIMALAGIPPRAMIDKLLLMLRDHESRHGLLPDGLEIGSRQCEALLKRHWKDENGENVHVPLGDYSDPHHSHCARIFNVSHELFMHHYRTARPRASQPLSLRTIQRMIVER